MIGLPKNIHILGAGGFIGGYLSAHLPGVLSGKVTGYSSQDCDLLDPLSISFALKSMNDNDVLVVASAITRLVDNTIGAMTRNISMITNLCGFLREHNVSQVVFLSTVDVYGIIPDEAIIDEHLPTNPSDYYSLAKLASEYLLKIECAKKFIPLVILRLPGCYGPGDQGKGTINAMVRSAKQVREVTISGDGLCLRDFVYVDDICRLIAVAVNEGLSLTVNVATGQSRTIVDIATLILKNIRNGSVLSFKPQTESGFRRNRFMIYDNRLLRLHFPNVQLTSIDSGIEKYLENFEMGDQGL